MSNILWSYTMPRILHSNSVAPIHEVNKWWPSGLVTDLKLFSDELVFLSKVQILNHDIITYQNPYSSYYHRTNKYSWKVQITNLHKYVAAKYDHGKVVCYDHRTKLHRFAVVHEAWQCPLDSNNIQQTNDQTGPRTWHHKEVSNARIYIIIIIKSTSTVSSNELVWCSTVLTNCFMCSCIISLNQSVILTRWVAWQSYVDISVNFTNTSQF